MLSVLVQLVIYLGVGAGAAWFLTSTRNGFLIVTALIAVLLWWLVLLYRTGGVGFITGFLGLGGPFKDE